MYVILFHVPPPPFCLRLSSSLLPLSLPPGSSIGSLLLLPLLLSFPYFLSCLFPLPLSLIPFPFLLFLLALSSLFLRYSYPYFFFFPSSPPPPSYFPLPLFPPSSPHSLHQSCHKSDWNICGSDPTLQHTVITMLFCLPARAEAGTVLRAY